MFQSEDTLLLSRELEATVLLVYKCKSSQQLMVDCFDPNHFRNSHSWIGTLEEFLTNTLGLDSLRNDLGVEDFNTVINTIKSFQ